MSIVISLDLGTSKICAVGYCTQQHVVLGAESVENSSLIEGLPSGYHEQSPDRTMACAFFAIKTLLNGQAVEADKVVGIAVTGQMHGVMLVDGRGKPVTNLITWRDQRASDLAVSMGDTYAKANGCSLRTGYGGATLGFWARHKQVTLDGDATALSMSDYACAVLSGKIASEPTHAASWGLYDITKQQWNRPMIQSLQIPESLLPDVRPTSSPLGPVLPSVANELGLNEEVVVYSPIGDNQAAVIGARGQRVDGVVLNLGTGGQISLPQKTPTCVTGFETRPMPDNTFILVGTSLCGGWAYAYLKTFFKDVVERFAGVEMSDQEVYAKMNACLETCPEAPALHVDPRFCGTRANPQIRGAIQSMGAENFSPEQLTQAFAKSMVQELFELVPTSCFETMSTLIASGNAIRKNPALLKIIAECFGKPVYLAQVSEETAVGAASVATNSV